MTSKTTPNATSSPESADGHSPCVLQDGATSALFGQEVAPASRSVSQGAGKHNQMAGTCGRNGIGSLASANLQQSLESKLREQLPTAGWMRLQAVWKPMVTPSGRRYYRLTVSRRTISENGFSLVPTLNAQDYRRGFSKGGGQSCVNKWIYKVLNIQNFRRGTAHPNFLCWFMGYPLKWTSQQPKG